MNLTPVHHPYNLIRVMPAKGRALAANMAATSA